MSEVIKKPNVSVTEPVFQKYVETPRAYEVVMCNPKKVIASFALCGILRKVFNLQRGQVIDAIMEAHSKAESVVWLGPVNIAEMKTIQAEAMRAEATARSKEISNIGFVLRKAPF